MYLFDTHADADKMGRMLLSLYRLDLNSDLDYDYMVEAHRMVKMHPSGLEKWATEKVKHTKKIGKLISGSKGPP